LLIGAALLLLIGGLLLVRPQAVGRVFKDGKTPPQELAACYLWGGILLVPVYLLFPVEAFFIFPLWVILPILSVRVLCSLIGPALTLNYARHRRGVISPMASAEAPSLSYAEEAPPASHAPPFGGRF
jgi:hypothetical protein